MAENVTKLEYMDKEIILVATAHVSESSVELVRETIAQEQPDSVCIELDEGRFKSIKDPKSWEQTDVVKVIRDKKVGFMLAQMALSAYQKRMAKKLGTVVGGEMLQGIKSAEENGAEIVLADRSIQTTFLRIWRLLGIKDKFNLIFSLFFDDEEDEDGELTEDDIKQLLEKDMLESVMSEVRDKLPVVGQVLIDERDQFLADKIKNAPGKKVLAVLGGAHVPGVIKKIGQESSAEEINRINTVPKKKSRAKYIGWIIPIVIIGLIIYGFTQSSSVGLQSLVSWWLWNGGLAALFTLICLGHPLSILTAFIVAPISSLNPFLACGWFAGLAEAWVRKPRVEDIQRIHEDIFHIKGFFKNRFLKTLLIVIMANIGSSIGTFVAGADIIRNIFG